MKIKISGDIKMKPDKKKEFLKFQKVLITKILEFHLMVNIGIYLFLMKFLLSR